MDSPALGPPAERILPLKDQITPLALGLGTTGEVVVGPDAVAADYLGQDLHPALLVLGVICVEVDDFAVVETNAEALLDEHVALFLLGES